MKNNLESFRPVFKYEAPFKDTVAAAPTAEKQPAYVDFIAPEDVQLVIEAEHILTNYPEYALAVVVTCQMAKSRRMEGRPLSGRQQDVLLINGMLWKSIGAHKTIGQIYDIEPEEVVSLAETVKDEDWNEYERLHQKAEEDEKLMTAIQKFVPVARRDHRVQELLDAGHSVAEIEEITGEPTHSVSNSLIRIRQKNERQKREQAEVIILDCLAQRPAILEDEAEIRRRILEVNPDNPLKPGPTPAGTNHVRRLSVVNRLKKQGYSHKEIQELSDIKSLNRINDLSRKLIRLGFNEGQPGPKVRKTTISLNTWVENRWLFNRKATYKDLAEKASNEFGREISVRQIQSALEKAFAKKILPRKKRSIEEIFELMDFYEDEHKKNCPDISVNLDAEAEFLGIKPIWLKMLKKRRTKQQQEEPTTRS